MFSSITTFLPIKSTSNNKTMPCSYFTSLYSPLDKLHWALETNHSTRDIKYITSPLRGFPSWVLEVMLHLVTLNLINFQNHFLWCYATAITHEKCYNAFTCIGARIKYEFSWQIHITLSALMKWLQTFITPKCNVLSTWRCIWMRFFM